MHTLLKRATVVTVAAAFAFSTAALSAGGAQTTTPDGIADQSTLVRPIAEGEKPGPSTAIVGGSRVTSPVPYIAALHTGSSFSCTASIIAPRYVITAKHCVGSPNLNVRIGSLTRSSGGTTATVSRVINAPGNNDVSILQLSRDVNATYLRVAAQGSLRVGTTERVYGWGYQNSNWTNLPENLKTSNGSVTQLNCATNFGDIACIRNNGDTSGGDSGGPMINSSGELIGVCSIGNKPTDGSGFGGYNTVVSSTIRTWIRQTAGV
ncbi:hypothetical protein ALI144C_09455 [Actinosynnema sp. ALI-1.44]|uniref:S1 family peptidase n=1 Tax=Actinosynnema sp. ALI-1.44 TaxID=1933779 RepID=UPI00097C0D5F|nr:trypsin-like serine protease [Actinosynnema sp. ALI-1.44]ONI87596.1 hypothetical protein ALI144C_09455 [Actinosynnema sp. ALI-1.44]